MAFSIDAKLSFSDQQVITPGTATLSTSSIDLGMKYNTNQGNLKYIIIFLEKKADLTIEVLTGDSVTGEVIDSPVTIQTNTIKKEDHVTLRLPDNRSRYLQLKITSDVANVVGAWVSTETTGNR